MQRTVFINVPTRRLRTSRVNADERIALEQLAELERMKLSEALRLAIREACKSRGLWPPRNGGNDDK